MKSLRFFSCFITFLPMLLCIACTHSNNKKNVPFYSGKAVNDSQSYKIPEKKAFKKDTVSYSSSESEPDERLMEPKPKKINYNFFEAGVIYVRKPFNVNSALKKLFPGKYYALSKPMIGSGATAMEAWTCSACPKKKYLNFWDSIVFPLKDCNITRVGKVMSFNDTTGKKSIIVAFATTDLITDLIPVGNGDGAMLSLALFTEEDTAWKLKIFTPELGYYGTYQDLPFIKLIRLGNNNYGCWFEDWHGPGGGPFLAISYVIGIVKNSFKVILDDEISGQSNSFANWDTKYHINPKDTTKFCDLYASMKGWYNKNNYDSAWEQGATFPDELKKYLKKNDILDFTIEKYFQFKDTGYIQQKEEVLISVPKG